METTLKRLRLLMVVGQCQDAALATLEEWYGKANWPLRHFTEPLSEANIARALAACERGVIVIRSAPRTAGESELLWSYIETHDLASACALLDITTPEDEVPRYVNETEIVRHWLLHGAYVHIHHNQSEPDATKREVALKNALCEAFAT